MRVLGMGASMVTVGLTVRHLGGESYGNLTTAIVFISLWTSLTELGVGAVITRRVTSGTGDLERLVRVNTGLSIFYSIPLTLISIGVGLAIYRDEPTVVQVLPIIGLSLALTAISSCMAPVFLVTVRFGSVAFSDFGGRALSLVLTLVLLHLDTGIVWFAVVQLVPPVVVLVMQGVAASRIISWRPVWSLSESWALMRESLPQTAVLIIGVLYWRIDGVLLSVLDTPVGVATYYLATTVAFTLSIVPTFFQTATLSTMTALYAEAPDRLARFTEQAIRTMMFLGLPIAAVGWVVAAPAMTLMGSDELDSSAGTTLAILLVAVGVTFLNGSLSQALFAAHQQVFLLRLNIVTLLINIGLNVALVPTWSVVGAAVALLVTEATGLVIVAWRLARMIEFRFPWRYSAALLVPTVIAMAAATLVPGEGLAELPISLGAAVAAYLVVNIAIGPVRIGTVRQMLGRGDDRLEADA